MTRADLLELRDRARKLAERARELRAAGLDLFAAEAEAKARRLHAELGRLWPAFRPWAAPGKAVRLLSWPRTGSDDGT